MDKKETIEVPSFEGYECIGVALPCNNLPCYVLTISNGMQTLEEANDNYDLPTICYRKIKPKRYVFEETGEYRKLRYGDYCIMHGIVTHWSFHDESSDSYKILRKIEAENE